MVKLTTKKVLSEKEFQLISIREEVIKAVEESGIQNGIVLVMSAHTTAGVMVNEDLEGLHVDMEKTLDKMAPVVADYAHSHYLPSYGATGGNAPGHLKQMLTGYEVVFPVIEGKALIRFAQDIYFAEFDGPQLRTYYIEVMGE